MKVAVYILTGLVAGLFSGALGVGGAIVATPLLRLAGISPYLAIGTTVPAILPGAITGAWTYLRANFVDSRAALAIGVPGAVFSFLGARATRSVDGHMLMIMTAMVLLALAIRLPAQVAEDRAGGTNRVGALHWFALLGAAAGFFSGLLGIGGGFLIVPVLAGLFGFPIKLALGTSLAVIALMAVPNIVGQAQAGNIKWSAALLLAVGCVPGARLGSMVAIRSSDRRLKVVVAVGLGLVAVFYAALELTALRTSR
ncbi:MAG: sulfite exporter TauE/SafE family protein [Actinomycetota bacterium]